MSNEKNEDTLELSLAVYAATAGTLAVSVLRDAGLISGENVDRLVGTLMAARLATSRHEGEAAERIEAIIEGLANILIPDIEGD